MRSAEDNLGLTGACLDELETYLLSPELFWPLSRRAASGSPPYPRLTLGNLLLTFDQLALQARGTGGLVRARQAWEDAQAQWQAALERKAAHEHAARLRLWSAFLEDLRERPELCGDYPGEVRNRVILTRLEQEFPAAQPSSRSAIADLDAQLRLTFRRGEFVWEAELRAAYPADTFWYLYGAPEPMRPER